MPPSHGGGERQASPEADDAARPIVTRRRDGDGRYGPMWRVLFDGLPTPFRITKSVPPKYRRTQQYDVIDGPDEDMYYMFAAPSLEAAISTIASVARSAILKSTGGA